MNKIRLIILSYALLMVWGCAQKQLAQNTNTGNNGGNKTDSLRILCYNIHHANPPSRPNFIDVEAIAKVIRDNTPDLVALQEVDVKTNRSGQALDQAAELARLSGMPYHYFGKAINHDGGEYGVAILSRFKMENRRTYPLPTEPETKGEPRVLATAVIVLPTGKKILFASTHLDAQRNDTNRILQIRKITEILQSATLPVIIAGDLNAVPESRTIQHFDNFFTRTCIQNCGFTVPVNTPGRTIDFVAFKPATAFTVQEHKVIDEKYASDHLPVKVVLTMNN